MAMTTREGFVDPYPLELLYEREPELDTPALLSRLTEQLPDAIRTDATTVIAFTRAGAEGSPRWVIDPIPRPVVGQSLQPAVNQSWSFSDAGEAVGAARFALTLTETGGGQIDFRERVALLNTFVATMSAATSPAAIHWIPTRQIVSPADFATAFATEGPSTLQGALNVRLFRIHEREDGTPLEPEEFIMDTLGLSAVGLDDLQCHFRQLSPDGVGHVLFNTALYLFEQGPVIRGGDSVQGLSHGERWRCELEDSILEPHRVVIDLDPGQPWAAGERGARPER